MRHLLLIFAILIALFGCDKTNDVTATSVNCGDDAIKCVPCEPDSLDCDGSTLLRCNADGRGYGVEAECETAQLCAEGLALGACEEPLCGAGEASCVGTVMQVCAAGRNRLDLRVCASEDACIRGLEAQQCAEATCSRATDCTGEDTECRKRVCVAGECELENLTSEAACTLGGVNGVCDGQGACRPSEQCAIGSDCPGNDTGCRLRVCVQGACGFADLPEATPCETARVPGLCDGLGVCAPSVDCSLASDCPGEDTQCRVRACVGGVCGFADLPMDVTCEIGGINGSCNGVGVCNSEAECNIGTDCAGLDTDCQTRACEAGVCGFTNAEFGAACTTNGFGGECDGEGGCTRTEQCTSVAQCPSESNPCRQAACSNGRCTTRSVSGSCTIGRSSGECSGGTCQCPSGTRLCGDLCVNTVTDTANCGTCNRACNTGAGEICRSSSCECPGEYDGTGDLCGGTCVSTETVQHCGTCTTTCGTNEVCDPRGVQRAECECAPNTTDCGNGCIPLNTNDHCGGCNLHCPTGTQCNNNGQCVCTTAGYAVCSNGIAHCDILKCQPTGTPYWTSNNCNPVPSHAPSTSSCGLYTESCCN